MVDLLKEIKQDHSNSPINGLCSAEKSLQSVEFMCFKAAQPLQQILSAFHNLSIQFPSELFQQIWKSKLRTVASEKLTLTIADSVTKIWKPVFDECCQLIDNVKELTITLADVNHHFSKLDERQPHLELLFKATEACHGREVKSTAWIRRAIGRMCLYWNVCEQADAAKTVLELKKSLKLEGDFKVIETVAGAFTSSMDKQTLNDIDEKLIEMSSFLEDFTKDRKKLECLKSFAACLDIVEWIRKESQGITIINYAWIMTSDTILYCQKIAEQSTVWLDIVQYGTVTIIIVNFVFFSFQMLMICTNLLQLLCTPLLKRVTFLVTDFPILKWLEVVSGL